MIVTYKAGHAMKEAMGTLKSIERDYIIVSTIGSGEDIPIFHSDLDPIQEVDDATPSR